MTSTDFDVVVVGAGPAGFVLAIDLGRRGVRTLLVERDPSTKEFPKMDRSNARTMEMFRRLGIAEEVRAVGYPPEASMDVLIVTRLADEPILTLEYPTVAEHRAVIAATTDASEPLEPYQLVSQNDLEPVLRSVAESTPNVTVRFGTELVDFEQDAEGVDVVLKTLDGAEETVRTSYLAGTDGGQSTVRKKLDIKLSGRGSLAQLRQIAVQSDDLYDAIPIGKARHYYFADGPGSTIVVQGSRKHFTLNTPIPEDVDVEQAFRDKVGFDVDFTVRGVTPWKFHLLLADNYRDGRVFLAGDAVHLVIPTGGLGMNTAVGDAVDLAWKLAGAVHGWAGPAVLDSYESERRKIGARNVEAAGWAAEGMGLWRALVGPELYDDTPEGAEARAKVAAAADQHHRRVHEMIGVELGYSYSGSEITVSSPDDVSTWETTSYDPQTDPGVRIPHIWLSDGRAMQDVLGADYTVLDLTGSHDTAALEAALDATGAPYEVVRLDQPHVAGVYGTSLLVLRPDLHIAWRGEGISAEEAEHVARTVTGHGVTASAPRG